MRMKRLGGYCDVVLFTGFFTFTQIKLCQWDSRFIALVDTTRKKGFKNILLSSVRSHIQNHFRNHDKKKYSSHTSKLKDLKANLNKPNTFSCNLASQYERKQYVCVIIPRV